MLEPLPTAIALTAVAVLLAVSALGSRASGRLGIPFALLFLVIGMAAGSEGIGRIHFEDYQLTFRVGTVALVMILFDGGLNTDVRSLRAVLAPAGVLATAGVAGTALLTALGARALGSSWGHALLLGAIVSSTDAAAVFSTLRGAGVGVKARLAHLLEVESGGNDPMAVILTSSMIQVITANEPVGWRMALNVPLQLAVGTGMGLILGYVGRWVIQRIHMATVGLYPALTLAVALIRPQSPAQTDSSMGGSFQVCHRLFNLLRNFLSPVIPSFWLTLCPKPSAYSGLNTATYD